MPWSAEQVKTFRALGHGWRPAGKNLGSLISLGKTKLNAMAAEGTKVKPKKGKK